MLSRGGGQARTYLHCSLELCLSRGDLRPWALPSCKFSFLLELEGGWLNVWARLRNCGESESSSGKVCQAEDSGEAGGVPGGESPGEKSYNTNRGGVCPYQAQDRHTATQGWAVTKEPSSWLMTKLFCFSFYSTLAQTNQLHHNPLLLISRCLSQCIQKGQESESLIKGTLPLRAEVKPRAIVLFPLLPERWKEAVTVTKKRAQPLLRDPLTSVTCESACFQ